MNKSILLSRKPKECSNILNLIQSIIVMKNCPKDWKNYLKGKTDKKPEPIDVYIYCTRDIEKGRLFEESTFGGGLSHFGRSFGLYHKSVNVKEKESYGYTYFNGKVVAKFTLKKVETIKYIDIDNYYGTHLLGEPVLEKLSCLSHKELENYLGGNRNSSDVCSVGYDWHIDNLVIFDKPKELGEFQGTCNSCEAYKMKVCKLNSEKCNRQLTKAPQSWCLVEVEVDEKED